MNYMIKSITLERVYTSMISTKHFLDMSIKDILDMMEKDDLEHITIDGIRFANADVDGRRVIREWGTSLFFDYDAFDAFMLAGGKRISPLSYGNFGVYPQCLDAFHHWLTLALLAACMLNDGVMHDVCEKFGGCDETL